MAGSNEAGDSVVNPFRAFVKAVVPSSLRFTLRVQASAVRTRGIVWSLRWNQMLAVAWLRDKLNRRRFTHLSETDARARRRSDTVFVFGSGYSLHDLTPAEWAHVAEHDVFGFNQFFYQRWVRTDFHLLRGSNYGELRWRPYAHEVQGILGDHRCYKDAVFVLQEGYFAQFSNQLIGYGLLPASARVLRFRANRTDGPPTRSLSEGLRHQGGTIADVVNCAFCLGWTHIVLVGVDLYDTRYFYLPPDKTVALDPASAMITGVEYNPIRGQRFDQPHNTVRLGIVDVMGEWREWLEAAGVHLSVYNPESLLADTLPVYKGPARIMSNSRTRSMTGTGNE